MTQTLIREAGGSVATFAAAGGAKAVCTLITPGAGSSGFYSAAVLEQAAKDKVFPKGLKLFMDHPSESEQLDRPERSVRDLAGVLTEDAKWNGKALVAAARIYETHRELLKAMQDDIGMSIRAMATMTGESTDGLPMVGRIVAAESVDFVTTPGRGGAYQLLESQRAGSDAVVASALQSIFGISESEARTGAKGRK